MPTPQSSADAADDPTEPDADSSPWLLTGLTGGGVVLVAPLLLLLLRTRRRSQFRNRRPGRTIAVPGPQLTLTSDAPILVTGARGAYAAFILQVPVLIGVAIAARPVPLPGFAKGVLVGALAIAGSFWLGWLLAARTKLGKIL